MWVHSSLISRTALPQRVPASSWPPSTMVAPLASRDGPRPRSGSAAGTAGARIEAALLTRVREPLFMLRNLLGRPTQIGAQRVARPRTPSAGRPLPDTFRRRSPRSSATGPASAVSSGHPPCRPNASGRGGRRGRPRRSPVAPPARIAVTDRKGFAHRLILPFVHARISAVAAARRCRAAAATNVATDLRRHSAHETRRASRPAPAPGSHRPFDRRTGCTRRAPTRWRPRSNRPCRRRSA